MEVLIVIPGTYTLKNEAVNPLTGVRFTSSTRPEAKFSTDSPGPIYDVRQRSLEVPTTGFAKSDR